MVVMKELINYLLDWWFIASDILTWTWLMMFTMSVSRLWVDGFIIVISSMSGW